MSGIEEIDVPETGEEWKEEEKQVLTELNLELDLDKPMQRNVVGSYINKEEMVGKSKEYFISGLKLVPNHFKPNETKKIIQLSDLEGNEYLLDFNSSNENFLYDTFGAIRRDWIGKKIKVSFKKIDKSDNKGELIKGVSAIFSL